jgi:hypothetical protein
MTTLNIEVGKSYFIHLNTRAMISGTVDKVSAKWIHIINNGYKERTGWVLRENITSVHDKSQPIYIISQMFDH